MRVISGKAKGRSLKAVPGMSTRPTTDKVKEAIFSMIGPYYDGGTALDLFAGTGGLGIEALSRGMDKCIFIDIEKKSLDTVIHNLETTGLREQAEVYRNDAARALKVLSKRDIQFQLVFLDPPYRMKFIGELVDKLQAYALLAPMAAILVEHDAEYQLDDVFGNCICERRVAYGDTAVTIYTYKGNIEE
ncbi:16S rRNA (guanine(966)-N(2))-methyltransferase RsmD [Paenibacillus albiflavus]|uniref:16S rRNA (Guanine(966)-N(2))-methyltransferase RsmD n=1 Tax=Paenibacillus albiflavus TaxID=2545760 RepID=A0A4V2WPM6_9BACL|nr:16S rRNA (guanine(966)-N(2))-methyltransferase RsmD [Paenibacillus albiflavus]TCZ79912.1 16S rRNA (guanine(966)-N(2))-methyltransferase RsmD [Paenibacillus albiflavus]